MSAGEVQTWAEELRENAGALAATLAAGGLHTDTESGTTLIALERLCAQLPEVMASLRRAS